MSELSPYDRLGVTEDASFEEVRDARNRIISELEGDEQQQELVEAAYDAILMDRLKARQEGRIRVPDRIRFPERTTPSLAPPPQPSPPAASPQWFGGLARLVDRPTRQDMAVSVGVFAGLAALNFLLPAAFTTWLALALLSSIYLLARKENRFGRALLLSLGALTLSVLLGVLLARLPALASPEFPGQIVGTAIFALMWLAACFLR